LHCSMSREILASAFIVLGFAHLRRGGPSLSRPSSRVDA
jgi:hypothetical protein